MSEHPTPHVSTLKRTRSEIMAWLLDLPDGVLPSQRTIARMFGHRDAWAAHCCLRVLHDNRLIDWRHGTKAEHRGHMIIRVRQTGRIYRTEGCPWETP